MSKSSELCKRLKTVSDMINMGEKIRWGEETALMDEAASHIEAQDRLIEEVTLERDRLKFVILSSYREMDWELIRAARYALEGTKSLPFKITGHEEALSQKDKP